MRSHQITDSSEEIRRAERYQESGRNQQAASLLRDVLARDSENFEASYALGKLYYAAGRNDLAIPLLKKAVRICPDDFEAALNLGIIERLRDRNRSARAFARGRSSR